MMDFYIPDEITCETQVFDIAFHPSAHYLAIGQVNGNVDVYQINTEDNYHVISIQKHKSSCRGLLFSEDGQTLYSISSDKSIVTIDSTGQVKNRYKKAHKDAINKITSMKESNVFATGDDSGIVKVWDCRVSMSEVMSWSLHEDFISGLTYDLDSQILISVAGDATLCAYDIRHNANTTRSDEQESEINCVEYVKDNRKVVCGTQEGTMLLFNVGRWGDCSDRFVGHPESIDCILKYDETTVLTGSSDGMIRITSILPNKILGVLGDHEEFPVEGIKTSYDGKILASYSHDEIVRFYDMSIMLEDVGEVDDSEVVSENNHLSASTSAFASVSTMDSNMEDGKDVDAKDNDEENNDDDSDTEEEDDDGDDSEEETRPKKAGGKKYLTPNQRFYSDL